VHLFPDGASAAGRPQLYWLDPGCARCCRLDGFQPAAPARRDATIRAGRLAVSADTASPIPCDACAEPRDAAIPSAGENGPIVELYHRAATGAAMPQRSSAGYEWPGGRRTYGDRWARCYLGEKHVQPTNAMTQGGEGQNSGRYWLDQGRFQAASDAQFRPSICAASGRSRSRREGYAHAGRPQ